MKNLLVIIDMENAFINEHTKYLISNILDIIKYNIFDDVVGTRYINNENTACYRFEGWKACMPNTSDIEIVSPLRPHISKIFDKHKYSCWNEEFKNYVLENNYDKLYFVGVNTGCCVLHSAFDCYNDVMECCVIEDLCGSTAGFETHLNAIKVLKDCITKQRVELSQNIIKKLLI